MTNIIDDHSENPKAGHSVSVSSNDEVEKPENLSHLSYTIAFALILHHLPEGIATFISLYYDFEFGLLVAFALYVQHMYPTLNLCTPISLVLFGRCVHDIPSGVCIAVPTYCATGSVKTPFLLCLAAAAAYPIGGFIGWLVVETASEAFIDSFIGVYYYRPSILPLTPTVTN